MGSEFSGFRQETLEFLADLAANNESAWFDANRSRYQEHLVEPARAFVEAIRPGLQALDPRLKADPRINGSIFRINRDTRFSADKRPYKEELGFRFPAGDVSAGASGFYLRIRPALVGLAAGVWGFPPGVMASYREAVADDARGVALSDMLDGLKLGGCRYAPDAYKRVPAPWPKEHPRGDLLRQKGLMVGVDSEPPVELTTPAFVDWCLERFASLAPVHRWLGEVAVDAG